MKKVLFCLLFVVGTTISVQAQVVYSCDFETASSRSGWRDGDHYMSYNTLTIGTAINHGGNYSLYTRPSANSSAFGYTAYTRYSIKLSPEFVLDTGVYVLSFDCYAQGNPQHSSSQGSYLMIWIHSNDTSWNVLGGNNYLWNIDWTRFVVPFRVQDSSRYWIRVYWLANSNLPANRGAAIDNILLSRQGSEPRLLALTSNNNQYGTVTGGGFFTPGDTATLTAAPRGGYAFMRWSDSVLTNPRKIVMWSDTAIQAVFNAVDVVGHTVDDTIWHNDTVSVYDTTLVTLYDTTLVTLYDTLPVYDTLSVFDTLRVWDTLWAWDTTRVTVYDTAHVTLYDTTSVTVYIIDTLHVTDTLWAWDTTRVTVYDTAHVTLYDTTPVTVYIIDTLHVTDTLWVYDTIHVTVYDTVRVEIEPVAATPWSVRVVEDGIAVEGAAGETITVYDLAGRRLYRRSRAPEAVRFRVPTVGVYLVQIGSTPARRVVLK